jgi:uncharacterized protein
VILIDANLAIYAYNQADPRHVVARQWLEASIAGREPIGFALVTVLAFVRITTDPRVHDRPLTTGTAIDVVGSWLAHKNVRLVTPTERHWSTFGALAARGQARGPMLMDAHLAALAIEHGATLATTDRDFSRFAGLRTVDPLGAA